MRKRDIDFILDVAPAEFAAQAISAYFTSPAWRAMPQRYAPQNHAFIEHLFQGAEEPSFADLRARWAEKL
ncbi:hypothetical protein RZS08_39060, partial [Arthrospira platensis SPKY1]|nr:hypothetical protein [Arthrospira platensis SPKY1]